MAPLMGVTLALVPTLAPLGIVAGFTVILLLWRSVWRSSWGIAVCFAVILGLSLYNQTEQASALGLIGLAWLVLVRSRIARRRRARVPEEEEIALDLELEQETELGPAAPDNP